MKKLHSLIIALLITSFSFGQNGINKEFENLKTQLSSYSDIDKKIPTPYPQNKKAVGDTIWSEDFTNGFPAGWSVYDSTGNNYNWVINNGDIENITANPSGYTQATAIASESGGNHMLLFADEYNRVQLANTGTSTDMNTFFQTSAISLTGQPAVTVHFQQKFRRNCSFGTALLMVSTDPTFSTNVSTYDIHGQIGSCVQSPDPMNMSFNISDIAAGLIGDIYLRFYIGAGITHYFWMIDDIYVTETGLNDITTHRRQYGKEFPTGYFGFEGYQYTRIPVSQIQPIDFQMIATNKGIADQPNTNLTVDINDGTSSIFNDSSNDTTMLSYTSDTLELNNFWTPPTSPLNTPYTITLDVFSDSIDETPWNNEMIFPPFKITSSLLALDDFSSTPGNGGGTPPFNVTEYEAGNQFKIFNQDEDLYAIDIVTGTNTPVNSFIDVFIYEIDYSTAPETYIEIWRSPSYSIQASDIGAVHHFNDSPGTPIATLTNGKRYFAGVHSLLDYEFATSGTNPISGTPSERHSAIRYPSMGNPNAYSSFGLTNTPMIRLNFNMTVGVDNIIEATNFILSPNPTSGKFTITINSDTQESKTLTIKNVIGQTIITKELTFDSSTKQDISLANYDKGIYFISLSDKIGTQTSKLIVE
jgi:hypothetical protein